MDMVLFETKDETANLPDGRTGSAVKLALQLAQILRFLQREIEPITPETIRVTTYCTG